MKKKYDLDIFRVLENADTGNKSFYEELSDKEKKAFSPLVTMKWMSIVNDTEDISHYYVTMVNDLVNVNFWDRSEYPDLQWLLLSICGVGAKMRHQWLPLSSQKKSANNIDNLILKLYPSANKDEIELFKTINSTEEICQIARDMGLSDKEVNEINKEYVEWKKNK